jgi:trimeric autotransporter adhesin
LLMGNGDGTFDPVPLTTIIPPAASPIALQIFAGADFNGDGVTDLIAPASNTSAVQPIAAVLLASNQTSSATANGITIPAGVGSGSLDGIYPGDSNYGPSTTGSVDVIAPLGASIVNVTASANSAALGSSITLTATVVGSGAPPVGTITFYDGSVQLAVAQLNSNATATYSTSSLPLGSNSITASYDGGGYYNQANSPAVVVTIFTLGTAVPTVTATASSATITSAQTDTVTVSVAGPAGSPTPTGTVVLTGANLIGGEPLANGSASFPIAAGTLSSGANTLTAAYSGDANYAPANGTVIVTVSPVGIAVPASSSVAPGASATATATLTADSSYSGTLNLTCKLTSSPAGATDLPVCSLAPASVSLKSGGGATSVLTVVTTAGSNARLQPINERLRSLGGETALAMIFLCGISARRRRWNSMLVLLSVAVVSLTIGCGGKYSSNGANTPGTSAGNYVFTLTGTDSANAAITTSATVQIVVQ